MATRSALLNAGRRAGEILRDIDAKTRIAEGYTRIDPIKIAEKFGVSVLLQPMEKLLGAYINENRPGIIVNVDRPPGLVHMTCAHELGHFFLDHSASTDTQIEYSGTAASIEQEADQFAYSLLVPQWLLANIMHRKGWTRQSLSDPSVLYQLSLRLGISYTSTIWTLVRNNVLSPESAQNYRTVQPKRLKQALTGKAHSVQGNSDVWLLDSSDRDVVLEPRENDVFVLELENNAGNGYVWSIEEVQSAGFHVLEPSNCDVQTEPVDRHFGANPLVGRKAPLRFTVSRPEQTDVGQGAKTSFAMIEHRPWLSAAEGDNRYKFEAEYEWMQPGLTLSEKSQLMEEAKAVSA